MERPNIVITNNRRVYQSLDLVDDTFFNGLTTDRERESFCDIIYELRLRNQTVPNGEAIVQRWDPRKRRVRKLRSMIPVADRASPPADLVRTPTARSPARSPAQSPLLELSPRLACQNDGNHALLSPTRGEIGAIADDLGAPWKFADVIFQRQTVGRVPLAPPMSVYLLVRPNENGIIEEQLAVKSMETNESDYFDQPGEEELKEPIIQALLDNAQQEIAINRLVELTRCSHIARYRGHSVRVSHCDIIETEKDIVLAQPNWKNPSRRLNRRTVSIYQDFAGFGDLRALIDRHAEKKRPINEHFIWYTLRELTEAMIALHEGPGACSKPHEAEINPPPPNELPSGPWKPIMHFDVKPNNVLLEVENTGDYPEYPKPVLADFGVSCVGNDDVLDLAQTDGPPEGAPRFSGTLGWFPPERHVGGLAGGPGYEPFLSPLSDKSDVWTLGLLAHAMVYAHEADELRTSTLSVVRDWVDNLYDTYESGSHFDTHSTNLEDLRIVHSAQLYLTIERCLRHNINNRPSLRDLLKICQDKLTHMDKMSGSTAGKRKRDDDSEDDTRLVTAGYFTQKFDKFGVGEIYRPKRVRMMTDIPEPDRHATYINIVDQWSHMQKPTPETQIAIIDALDQSFLNVADGHSLLNQGNEHRWAMLHLVSCLRKRCEPKGAAYVLTGAHYRDSDPGWAWIRNTFELEIKLEILDKILADHDFWVQASSPGDEGVQVAIDAFQNAISWGRIMLFNTEVPANETDNFNGRLAEPREPRMEEQSALHLGIYDWIFVLPRGALYLPLRPEE